MTQEASTAPQARCISCGFEATAGSDAWDSVDHPPLGSLTKCPECGSTDIHTL